MSPEELMSAGKVTVQEYMEMIAALDSCGVEDRTTSGEPYKVGLKVLQSAQSDSSLAPKHDGTKPDKSIMLSHVSSGGMRTGKVLNRFGKAEK